MLGTKSISYEYITTYESPEQPPPLYHYTRRFSSICYVDGEMVGEFEITGSGFEDFNVVTGSMKHPMAMGICVDDEYQGRGITRTLIGNVCEKIKQIYPAIRHDQLIFIDVDASAGFWEKIGLKDNRYFVSGKRRDLVGQGYEKNITFNCLCKWGRAK